MHEAALTVTLADHGDHGVVGLWATGGDEWALRHQAPRRGAPTDPGAAVRARAGWGCNGVAAPTPLPAHTPQEMLRDLFYPPTPEVSQMLRRSLSGGEYGKGPCDFST